MSAVGSVSDEVSRGTDHASMTSTSTDSNGEARLRRPRQTFTVPEAAELLGISRAKAYQCVHTGEIRAVQFGRRIVVPASAIEELLGTPPDAA